MKYLTLSFTATGLVALATSTFGLAQTPSLAQAPRSTEASEYRYAEIVTKPFVGMPFNTSAAVDSGQVEVIVTRSGREREDRDLDYAFASPSAAMNALAPLGYAFVQAAPFASEDRHQLRWIIRRPVSPAERGASATPTPTSTRTEGARSNR